ncbi:MAG TPA: putative quinol monooxygenase [Bryobacteraceae bacterium]|jgi:quinol monooxygenase YgiN
MSLHFVVRFEPRPGKAEEFRQALLAVIDPSRAESGCIDLQVFESVREPVHFAIHSEWVDETAFELHARMPHTMRFLEAAKELLPHPVEGFRGRPLAGGAGAARA